MGIFEFTTVIAQDAGAPLHVNSDSFPNIGVFTFVLAIIFMSFVFKVIKLHYESRENNHAKGAASGADNALGANAAVSREKYVAAVKDAAQRPAGKSGSASFLRGLLIFVACCFVVLTILSTLFFVSFSDRTVTHQTSITEEIRRPTPLEAPIVITPEAVPFPPNENSATRLMQPHEAPDDFIADVYPSVVDCAAPLAIKVYNEVSDRLPAVSPPEAEDFSDEKDEDNQNKIAEKETPEPTVFYIINNDLSKQDYIPFVVAFRKKIQAKIKNSSVEDVNTRSLTSLKKPKSYYFIYVDLIQKVIKGLPNHTAGQVVCRVRAKDLSTEVIAQYVQKLWFTDYEAFSKKNPDRQFVIGRDDGFFPDQSQARQQALKNAGVGATVDSVAGTRYAINGRMFQLIDEVCQKYERSYGDVFRCSVLLERDRDKHAAMVNVNPAATNNFNTAGSQQSSVAALSGRGWKPSFEWSIALLIGLTVVIGTISNALTQGYYRTEISRSTMFFVLAGFSVLLLIVLSTIG